MNEFKDNDNSRETKQCSCDDKEVTQTYNQIYQIIIISCIGLTKHVYTKSDFSHNYFLIKASMCRI